MQAAVGSKFNALANGQMQDTLRPSPFDRDVGCSSPFNGCFGAAQWSTRGVRKFRGDPGGGRPE